MMYVLYYLIYHLRYIPSYITYDIIMMIVRLPDDVKEVMDQELNKIYLQVTNIDDLYERLVLG